MNIIDKTLWVVSGKGRFSNTPEGLLLLDFERDMYCDLALLAADRMDPRGNHGEGDCAFARNSSSTSETHTRDRNLQIGGITGPKRVRPETTVARVRR